MSAGGAQVPGAARVGHVKAPPSLPPPPLPPPPLPPASLPPSLCAPPVPLAPPVPAPPLPPPLVPPGDPEPELPLFPLVVPPDPAVPPLLFGKPQPMKRTREIGTASRRSKRAPSLHVIVGAPKALEPSSCTFPDLQGMSLFIKRLFTPTLVCEMATER